MAYILLFILLLNTSIFFNRIFKNKIEQNYFISIFSYILILFVFGLFKLLNVGFVFILILNLFLLIYNIYSIIKKKYDFKSIFTFGFIIFFISYLLIVWLCFDRVASVGDEFSHWAIIVKNMFNLNSYGLGSDSTVLFKKYLSGTSIFQYFCVKLTGNYNEGMMYIGMDVMLLSVLIPMFSKLEKNKLFSYLLVFFVLLIPTWFYFDIYTSLYVDGVLGVTFAYSLYSYFINRNKTLKLFDYVNLACSYCMLIFIKDFGVFLSGISLMIILIDNMFVREKFKIKNVIKNNYMLLLTIIPALIIKIIWTITLKINHVSSPWSTDTGSSIIQLLTLNFLPYQKSTISNFFKGIFTISLTHTNISITCFVVLLLFIVLGYYYVNTSSKNNISTSKVVSYLVVFGAICYGGLLLLAYNVVFSEYEAVRIASFDRYMGTYAVGGLIVLIALLINNISDDLKKVCIFTITLIGIFIINYDLSYLHDVTFFARYKSREALESRASYKEMVSKVFNHLDKNDHIYFVSTNDTGLDFLISRYELTPIRLNDLGGWSIGKPYYEGDIWTIDKDIRDWRSELQENYTYVYLYDIDEQFIEIYGDLFISDNIVDNQLYRVIKNDDLTMLELVE